MGLPTHCFTCRLQSRPLLPRATQLHPDPSGQRFQFEPVPFSRPSLQYGGASCGSFAISKICQGRHTHHYGGRHSIKGAEREREREREQNIFIIKLNRSTTRSSK